MLAVIAFITYNDSSSDLRKDITSQIEQLYEDNAYIILKNVTQEEYLLLNDNKESVLESENCIEVYLNNGKMYQFDLSDESKVFVSEKMNEIELLSYYVNHRGTTVITTDTGYEVIVPRNILKEKLEFGEILTDPTISNIVYKVENTDENVFVCSCFTENTAQQRTLLWEINGYQKLFSWKLNDEWYNKPSRDVVYTLYTELLDMVNKNVLSLYDTVGDKEAEWNVRGKDYKALDESIKSLNVDRALLYLQNYNLGFVGNKADLLVKLDEFYSDVENEQYSLYTAVQYICALEEWLITGVNYNNNEELVISEETQVDG